MLGIAFGLEMKCLTMNLLTTCTASNPLRIAMLCIHSSPLGPLGSVNTGGMSVYVRELARYLGILGHEVDIFSYGPGPAQPIALSANVRLVYLNDGHAGKMSKDALPDHLTAIYQLLDRHRRINSIEYDLIHSHYWISGVVGAMVQAQWRCPHITMFHTLGLVKNLSTPLENESDRRIAHERWLAKVTDHIIVPAKLEHDHLVRHYHARSEKVSIIPCGVNLALFRTLDRSVARRQLSVAETTRLLLYVGRFAPLKGLDLLIDAVGSLKPDYPRLRLMIVGGDGPNAASTRILEELVQLRGLISCVDFAGRVDQERLPPYYNAADLLVLPSHYESFGLVVLEALACGTPVAATPVGAAETLLRTGRNGILFNNSTAESVVRGIRHMLDRSPNQRTTGEHIRTTVLNYGWDRIAAAVAKTYDTLLREHEPKQRLEFYPAGTIYPN